MKSKIKKISLISAIVIALVLTVFFALHTSKEKVAELNINNNEEKFATNESTLYKNLEKETASSTNCQYDTIGNGNIILMEYYGDKDFVIIPEKINEIKVEKISPDAFTTSEDLEVIKMPAEIAQNMEIDGFEINEELSDKEYKVFTTTKEYTEQYLEYIKLSDEEKKSITVIPTKFAKTWEEVCEETDSVQLYATNSATTLPSAYDLRDDIQIETDDQKRFGLCALYAANTSLETHIALKYGEIVDFSEIDFSMRSVATRGGFVGEMEGYWSPALGPVNEIPNTFLSQRYIEAQRNTNRIAGNIYKELYEAAPIAMTSDEKKEVVKALEDVGSKPEYYVMSYKSFIRINGEQKKDSRYESTILKNRNSIKESIMKYGSTYAEIRNNTNRYAKLEEFEVMCCSDETGTSHAVSIIGWDDNFSKDNFPEEWGVTQDGAWLVLNSWGKWGNGDGDGTFWISYQDYNIERNNYSIVDVSKGQVDINDVSIIDLKFGENNIYNGNEKTPEIKFSAYNNTNYKKDIDYTVEYSNNVNAGTATVTIAGINRFTGTLTKTFEIEPKNINLATLTYDGTLEPSVVTIKDGEKILIEDTDYVVTYTNNTNEGTVTIRIEGKGNYTGALEETVRKSSKSINLTTVELETGIYVYDGTAKTPNIEIKDGEKILTEYTDYTLTYTNNTEVGTAMVTIEGIGNYSGTTTVNFAISYDISSVTINLYKTEYRYSKGYEAKPTVDSVKDGDKYLRKNTDYIVEYSNNTKVGTGIVTIKGIGNYTGIATTTFEIVPTKLDSATLRLEKTEYEYDGTAKEPLITYVIENNIIILSPDNAILNEDYTVRYENNINPGIATVILEGKSEGYVGTAVATFKITKNIELTTIEIEKNSYEYDGTEKTPEVIIKDGDKILTKDIDYTVKYMGNVDAGYGYIDIQGKGFYTGRETKNFNIMKKNINAVTIKLEESCEYDGTAKTPEITVLDGNKILIKDKNYKVEYRNNTNAGTATVEIRGYRNYEGTVEKKFEINPKDISIATIGYDGTIEPAVITVRDGEKTLINNRDYTATCTENTNEGIVTIAIEGEGNYTETLAESLPISSKSITLATIELDETSYFYDGEAKIPAITVIDGNKALIENTDYTLTYSNNVNVGTAKVVLEGKGDYSGTAIKTFEINGIDLNLATVELLETSFIYDGTAKTPEATVIFGDKILTKDIDYTLEYTNNINAGTATLDIIGKGIYGSRITKTFEIRTKDINSITAELEKAVYTYTGTFQIAKVILKDGSKPLELYVDYGVKYSGHTNVGIASVTIEGRNNYSGQIRKTFEITPVDISSATVSYNGTGNYETVTVECENRILERSIDYTQSIEHDKEMGTVTVTINGKGNYTGTIIKTFSKNKKSIALATAELEKINYTYNGEAKIPEPLLKDGYKTLVKDTDYTLEYSNNTNIGTATITITGIGIYEGTKNVTFEISSIDLKTAVVELEEITYSYDGIAKTPEITVALGDETLVKDTNYTVEYSNNINAGTATVTIIGIGNYTGAIIKTFKIIKDIDLTTATLKVETYEYDGKEKKPNVTVKDKDITLLYNTDYTVEYSNNMNAGTATVTITGIGTYTGTLTKNFEITPEMINTAIVTLAKSEYTYSIEARTPEITVRGKNRVLTNNTDYTVEYSNNTNVGMATVTITGKGNYSGTVTKTFEITRASINITTIELEETTYAYDGTAKTPAVTVKIENKTLTKDTDYTVAYSDNTNVGRATVRIDGKGNYSGSKTATFEITGTSINAVIVELEETTYAYDGTAKTPAVTVTLGNKILTKDTDYTVTYSDNTNAGTATVTITGKGNYSGSKTATFEITGTSINTAVVELEEATYAYDGTAKTPAVTVKIGDKTLTKDTDYTVAYTNNTNAGTATVTVDGISNYLGTKTAVFTIEKVDYPYSVPSGLIVSYDSTLKDITLPNGFEWEDDLDTKVGEVGYNTFKCTYTPEDTTNYNITKEIEVIVKVIEKVIVDIDEYKVEAGEDNKTTYITGIDVGGTIDNVEEKIKTNGTVEFYEKDGTKVTDNNSILKTGMKMRIHNEIGEIEHVIVVTGDNNGDGKTTITDVVRANLCLVNIKDLKDEYLKAADMNKDGRISITDIVRVKLKSVHM